TCVLVITQAPLDAITAVARHRHKLAVRTDPGAHDVFYLVSLALVTDAEVPSADVREDDVAIPDKRCAPLVHRAAQGPRAGRERGMGHPGGHRVVPIDAP